MDDDYGSRSVGYQGFELAFVDVERVGSYVRKHGLVTVQSERVCARHEGVRRYDHFVVLCASQQESSHLERVCARGREQCFLDAAHLFDQSRDFFGERTIPAQVLRLHHLCNVLCFTTGNARSVEWDCSVHPPNLRSTTGYWQLFRAVSRAPFGASHPTRLTDDPAVKMPKPARMAENQSSWEARV